MSAFTPRTPWRSRSIARRGHGSGRARAGRPLAAHRLRRPEASRGTCALRLSCWDGANLNPRPKWPMVSTWPCAERLRVYHSVMFVFTKLNLRGSRLRGRSGGCTALVVDALVGVARGCRARRDVARGVAGSPRSSEGRECGARGSRRGNVTRLRVSTQAAARVRGAPAAHFSFIRPKH